MAVNDGRILSRSEPQAAGGVGGVRLFAEQQKLVTKLGNPVVVKVDQMLKAHLNMSKVHVFDNETERNVSLEPDHVDRGS